MIGKEVNVFVIKPLSSQRVLYEIDHGQERNMNREGIHIEREVFRIVDEKEIEDTYILEITLEDEQGYQIVENIDVIELRRAIDLANGDNKERKIQNLKDRIYILDSQLRNDKQYNDTTGKIYPWVEPAKRKLAELKIELVELERT